MNNRPGLNARCWVNLLARMFFGLRHTSRTMATQRLAGFDIRRANGAQDRLDHFEVRGRGKHRRHGGNVHAGRKANTGTCRDLGLDLSENRSEIPCELRFFVQILKRTACAGC
jgi:hypothetical protein